MDLTRFGAGDIGAQRWGSGALGADFGYLAIGFVVARESVNA